MENFNILTFLNDYSSLIGAIPIIAGGIWGFFKFREHVKDKRFKTYHDLIDQMVNEQREADRKIKLDRQIAVIYELRNFQEYFDVSIRILKGLKKEWENNNNPRVIEEIDLTLDYMESNWFSRLFK